MTKKPPGINIKIVDICKHGVKEVCQKCLNEFRDDLLNKTRGGLAIEDRIIIEPTKDLR